MAAASGVNPDCTAMGRTMAPTSATAGDGHKNRENTNIMPPKIHQETAGVLMTFDTGRIRRASLPSSCIHFENAVTRAMVAITSRNSLMA